MDNQLTQGAISSIANLDNSEQDPSLQSPTLQVINVKRVGAPTSTERYRIIVSDGTKYIQGLLATQLNHLIHKNELVDNCFIKLNKFVKNNVHGRNLVVCLDLTTTNYNPGERVGDPIDAAPSNGGGGGGGGFGAENVNPQQQRSGGGAAQGMYGNNNFRSNNNNNNKPINNNNSMGGRGGNNNNPYGGRSNNNNNGFGGGRGGGSAPIERTTPGGGHFTPIANLNMYQSRWTIRARVTTKSDIRTWSNARGEGSLFSIELLDGSGMDIRCTFFKEAVDKFYNQLEEGNVYTFSGGRIKVANIQYNTCKSNFEITFDQNTEIHLQNDGGDIKKNLYDFIPNIAHLENVEQNKMVDLIAIVKTVGEPTTLMSKKSGQELTKCDLTLVDDSGTEIKMTIWGQEKANKAPVTYANSPVVAFRRVKVSDFGGKSLSLNGNAEVNPQDCPDQVNRLQQWWEGGGKTGSGNKSLSQGMGGGGSVAPFHERLDIASIKGKHLGHGEKPDWLTFKGTVSFIKKDKEGGAWYPACANANDPCKNMFKVSQTTDGNWYCDKCQGTYPNPVRRWIFSGTIEDDTCSTWVSFFDAQAKTLLGGEMSADDAYSRFKENDHDDQDGYDSLFHKALHTEWIFKCKVKTEMVNEEQRVKTNVFALQPVDYVKESENMLAALAKWA